MTHDEFVDGFDRLSRGFKQRMTGERAEAIWKGVRNLSLPAWDAVVDKALGGTRMPDIDGLIKIAADVRKELGARGTKMVLCECGGQLNAPTDGPQGCHVVDEPLELSAMGQVEDRRERPDRWGIYMFRVCADCGARYLMATEKRRVRRRDGSTVYTEPGMILPIRSGYTFEMPPYEASEVASNG